MKIFKKLTHQNIGILICVVLISTCIKAQQISLELGTGLSGITYELDKGKSSMGLGLSIGGNYTYALNNQWNIIGGLHLGMYNSDITLEDGNYKTNEIDDTNTGFELTTSVSDYIEKQKLFTLSIPVLAQFYTYLNRDSRVYLAAGGKLIVPVQQFSSTNASSVALSGYYPNTNLTINDLPQHGFGTISTWEDSDTPVNLSMAIALSLQAGMDFNIGKKIWYAGLYFDYGINDIIKADRESSFISYNANGIDKTKAAGIANSEITKSAKLMSVGIHIRLLL